MVNIRIKANGGMVPSTSPAVTKYVIFDFGAILAKDLSFYTEKEGALSLALDFNVIYDTVNSLYFKATVYNGVATLP